MADCECLNGCPFFNDKMPEDMGLGSIFKTKYCQGDNSNCARYMVLKSLGKPAVPADIYPNQHDRAKKMIATVQ